MNEELKQKAAQALSEILDLALKTKDFVVEQAPDVVSQLLAWNFSISLIHFLLGVLILVPLLAFFAWVLAKKPFRDSNMLGGFGVGITACVAIGCLTEHQWIWLKIWIAPKLFLLEYAATLVK